MKEKEFELLTTKNQKLESLCRALHEERKSLHEKVQGAQPDANTSEGTADTEAQEAPRDPKEESPVQDAAPPAPAGGATPLTQELARLKAEQALLKELAGSFTISHVAPTETDASRSHGPPGAIQEEHVEERSHKDSQDGRQHQRETELESVD